MHMTDFTCWTSHNTGTYLSVNDEIGVTCGVQFGGGWKPELTCEVAGNHLHVNYMFSGRNEVTSSFRGRAVKEFADLPMVCSVRFNISMKPASSLRAATNVPVYDRLWTSIVRVTCKYDLTRYL